MRTSNKILLGGFVATILIITGIHAVLYAKIKNGDLVAFEDEKLKLTDRIVLGENIKHMRITGIQGGLIAPGDTAIMQLDTTWLKKFKYSVTGDTLIIDGGLRQSDYEAGDKQYVPLGLELPHGVSITANYCQLELRGATDSTKAISRSINITNSELRIMYTNNGTKTDYWKSVQLNALRSNTYFGEATTVNELSVNLNVFSNLTDGGADLQQFSVQVDSTSTVSLRKKSLNNIKLVK
jgi:hypothetical protein